MVCRATGPRNGRGISRWRCRTARSGIFRSPICPRSYSLLRFPQRGILFGLPPSDEPVAGQIVISNISAEAERRFSEISRQGRVRLNPKGFAALPFARFLAKIAHAHTVAELGMDGFYAALPPIILERDPHFVFHYVGSGGGDEPTSTCLHDLNLRRQRQLAAFSGRGPRELLVVRIRLFARHGLPTHYVVVGEPQGTS
jgi:hypothetical protein